MKRSIGVIVVIVTGCSGPIALQRAIWHQHEAEPTAATAGSSVLPRDAWYADRATRTGATVAHLREADQALSTTRNPFDARTDAEAVSRGAIVFRDHCARCHGLDVRGQGPDMLPAHPTKDFHAFGKRFAVTLHGGAPRAWFRKIAEGYGDDVAYPQGPSRAMPAFGDVLAREQIWLAITYLQSLDIYAKPDPAGGTPAARKP